jgi:hypothetical protein
MGMNPREFIETQMRLIEIGKIADSLNFDDFLKSLTNAEDTVMKNGLTGTMAMKDYDAAKLSLDNLRRLAEVVAPVKLVYAETYKPLFRGSSAVEQSAVNRSVAGSIPAPGATKGPP